MGCGISTLDVEEASHGHRSNKVHQHAIVQPVVNNKPIIGKDYDNGDDGVDEEAKMKEERYNGERLLKEKCVVDMKEKEELNGSDDQHANAKNGIKNDYEEENEDRDDGFIGPGSPSFRDYCKDYESVDRSSVGDPNDFDSGESTKNTSDDDSTNRSRNGKRVNYKEPEKKERRGRGFRNVIHKGRTRGKRNLLNFACYNAGNQSYAEGSFNKI